MNTKLVKLMTLLDALEDAEREFDEMSKEDMSPELTGAKLFTSCSASVIRDAIHKLESDAK